MDILNVVITKKAIGRTENATYNLEYSISDNRLLKIMATIYSLKTENQPDGVYIGQITFENEIVTASFMGKMQASKLFVDFEDLMRQIREDVNPK
ncbi:MAG: hypothetical protein LBT43_14190 [Prevotella sp.]|jgi:hypothetical protein|nr:hypothetical protein [Prevotella sp.]